MDTNGRLVAGSHNRNEFVLINADDTARVSVIPSSLSQTCLLFNILTFSIAVKNL